MSDEFTIAARSVLDAGRVEFAVERAPAAEVGSVVSCMNCGRSVL